MEMNDANILKINNGCLDVCFYRTSGVLKVKDLRCGKVWEQFPLNTEIFRVTAAAAEKNAITATLQGNFEIQMSIRFAGAGELDIAINAPAGQNFDKLYLPQAFKTPDETHYILQTDSQGLLLAADDKNYPLEEQPVFYCGGGPGMAWMGLVDSKLEAGYMTIFETPFDQAVALIRENELITFAPVLLGCMGEFGYERRLKYVFFDRGGYVAQCKRYRRYIWPKNGVKTLKENEKRFPAIKNMLGAVHIYVWDRARQTEFAKEMKEAGIEKALILWDTNHLPYPEEGYDDRLRELGYSSGAYELFSEIHHDLPDELAGFAKMPLKRNVFPGKFEEITARRADGTTYSNEFGTYVCPVKVISESKKQIEKELKAYPHDTYFVDVYQANGLYECYHPQHPLTRQQYAEAIIANLELLQNEYGVFVGGEFGADFAAAQGIYVHGMMTLQRTWFNGEREKEGTIHYYGNWNDNERPSVMVGTRTAGPAYLKYSINEESRVPLYELVYHDAVVTSWRWEDCNHHCPEIWWKKDLFNILYGSAPLWSLDRERWDSFRMSFVESYQKVCPWLQQVCYDEMTDHRFITEDRRVQETVYSSGKRVIVNFGDLEYPFEGKLIKPRDFIIF